MTPTNILPKAPRRSSPPETPSTRRLARRLCGIALLLGAALGPAGPAMAQDSVFSSYSDMRGEMDNLLMQREIEKLMLRFGGADEMTQTQLANLDRQVEAIYPVDLENRAVVLQQRLGNGFTQELIAYWTGLNYLYAYVFYHERDGRVVSINYRFNSDFHLLRALF